MPRWDYSVANYTSRAKVRPIGNTLTKLIATESVFSLAILLYSKYMIIVIGQLIIENKK